MQISVFSVFSILALLSGTPVEDRFDLTVQVGSAPGIKQPAEVRVTVDGAHTGQHSTILLPGRTAKFPGLASGSYRITVEAEGYQPSQVELEARTALGDEHITVDVGPPISSDKEPAEPAAIHYQALRLSPEAQVHWEEAGKALTKNQLDSALRSLEQVIRVEPDFASAYSAVGAVSLKINQWDRAEQAFLKAAELGPDDYRYQVGLGWFYLQNGRAPRALAPLKKAVELQPKDAEAHAYLGEAMRLTGSTEKAVTHLKNAVFLAPKLPFAVHSLALAYLDLDQPERALHSFRALLQTKSVPDSVVGEVKKLVSELEKKVEWKSGENR